MFVYTQHTLQQVQTIHRLLFLLSWSFISKCIFVIQKFAFKFYVPR